jgi:Tfp pilus assembly protein PilF
LGNAVLSYGLYLKKAIWPTGLALLYPHPGFSLQWWKVLISALVLGCITILVLIGRRHRYLPVGWFWFLGTLIPMIVIVQVGVQGMADRYAYTSFLGLFIMICWGVTELFEWKQLSPTLLAGLSAVVLLSLGLAARRQINLWQQEEVLWEHALKVTDQNWVAEGELGVALAMHGRVPEAALHFNNALMINPNDSNSNLGIAIYDLQQGNFSDAIVHYQIVLKQPTTRPSALRQAYLGLAQSCRALGERQKSQDYLQKLKALSP